MLDVGFMNWKCMTVPSSSAQHCESVLLVISLTQMYILRKLLHVADYIIRHRAKYGLKLQVSVGF